MHFVKWNFDKPNIFPLLLFSVGSPMAPGDPVIVNNQFWSRPIRGLGLWQLWPIIRPEYHNIDQWEARKEESDKWWLVMSWCVPLPSCQLNIRGIYHPQRFASDGDDPNIQTIIMLMAEWGQTWLKDENNPVLILRTFSWAPTLRGWLLDCSQPGLGRGRGADNRKCQPRARVTRQRTDTRCYPADEIPLKLISI